MYTKGEWKVTCLGSEGFQVRLNKEGIPATVIRQDLLKYKPIIEVMGGSFEEQKANAEFIVKAVNSYDAMYEALEAVIPTLQGIFDKHGNRSKHIKDRINMAVEALAKA